MIRVWTAAADGEEPKEASREGKDDGEPGSGKHGFAKISVDVVRLENVIESAEEGSVEDGCSKGRSKHESRSHLVQYVSSFLEHSLNGS